MKTNVLPILLVGVLAFSIGFSQQAGEPRTTSTPAGEGSGTMPEVMHFGAVEVATNTEQGQQMYEVQTRLQQRLEEATTSTNTRVRNTQSHQVRAYVQGLNEAGDIVGGTKGEQIREVARTMNGTVNAMTQAEERVQSRNAFMKFLFGSDKTAVDDMETQMTQTQAKITEMKQLAGEVSDEAAKAMIQEQISNMEQLMTQVQDKVQTEKQAKGLLGFLFGR